MVQYCYVFHPLLFTYRIDPKNADAKGQKDAYECNMTIKEAEKAFEHQQWDRAKHFLTTAIRFAEQAPTLLLKKAICNFSLKDYYETISDTGVYINCYLI